MNLSFYYLTFFAFGQLKESRQVYLHVPYFVVLFLLTEKS